MRRFDPHVAAWGALAVAGSLFFADRSVLLGAAAGAALAAANWLAFRRMAAGSALADEQTRFLAFLVIKTLSMLGAVALIIHSRMVHPLAFAAGLSIIVAGISSGALTAMRSGRSATIGDQGS